MYAKPGAVAWVNSTIAFSACYEEADWELLLSKTTMGTKPAEVPNPGMTLTQPQAIATEIPNPRAVGDEYFIQTQTTCH